jgi:acetylornithine/succinyldiaminopimelate/putrescine aminotransferase
VPVSSATNWQIGACCARRPTNNTIRFAPPLVIKKEEVDWALEQIDAVMTA